MSAPVLLFATASAAQAPQLVRQMVEERLVACGNIVPGARSFYRWEGAVQDEAEALVFMETRGELVKQAMARFAELHEYDVPKILVLDPFDVWGPYATWVNASVKAASGGSGSGSSAPDAS